MPDRSLSRIRSAAIDGRARNIYYKQGQLEKLHHALAQNAKPIQDALSKDAAYSTAEAKLEFIQALKTLREHYSGLNPDKELQAEYAIARNQDAADNREPVGIVVIDPSTHSFLFSIVAPLSAAFATGNCVIIQVEKSLRETPSLLQSIFTNALDADTFYWTTSKLDEAELPDRCLWVLQNGSPEVPKVDQLVSQPESRVVAIVDRESNVQEAAKALVAARFGFGGKSPYSPDVVLVNEWVKKDFLTAAAQHAIIFMSGENGPGISKGVGIKSRAKNSSRLLDDVEKEGTARVVTSGSGGLILDIERESSLLKRKANEACLLVHSVSSLDDALDLSNSFGSVLATFVFAPASIVKYMGQFLEAEVLYANHVPSELLVGPAAPANHPVQLLTRYSTTMFTVPRPRYIKLPLDSITLSEILLGANIQRLQKLESEATGKLPVIKKRAENRYLGFFDQGILLAAGMVLIPTALGLGSLGVYGFRVGLRHWR